MQSNAASNAYSVCRGEHVHARKATLEFVEKFKAAPSVEVIGKTFLEAMSSCGIRYAALASHTDPVRPAPGAVMICNYERAYQEWFSENDCAKYDPVFWYARRELTAFHWSELPRRVDLTAKQQRILNEAREFGIADGMTIPLIVPGAMPASCSLVPGPDGLEPMLTPDIAWMAASAHLEILRRLPEWKGNVRLTNEQRDVMFWAARGKSDPDIGAILNVKPRTVGKRIDAVRALYDVASRSQAIMMAVAHGEIQAEILLFPNEMQASRQRDSK